MRLINSTQETEPQPNFQPLQIVCLENTLCRLYAEVVQTVEVKQTCWVRPLVLAEYKNYLDVYSESSLTCPQVHDLRHGADLLLPTMLFRVAMDVEVIPLLSQLGQLEDSKRSLQETHVQLNQFIRDICLAHPEAFSNEVTKH